MDSVQLAGIVADVTALIHDAGVGTSVTVYTSSQRAYSFGAGTVADVEPGVSVTAWVSELGSEEAATIDGARVGDRKVLVVASDLTTAPRVDSRVSIGGVSHSVYHVDSGPLSTHYVLLTRKVS
jgi:hypothetical protein